MRGDPGTAAAAERGVSHRLVICLFEADKVSRITTPIGMGDEHLVAIGRLYVREFVRGQQPEDRHEGRTARRKLPYSGFHHVWRSLPKDSPSSGPGLLFIPRSKGLPKAR